MTSTDSITGVFSPEGEKSFLVKVKGFLSGHNSSNVLQLKVNIGNFEAPVSIIALRL